MAEPTPHILEPGGTEVSTAAGGARKYRKPLIKFRWRDIWAILKESFSQWSKHNAPRLGASLSFYTLLSLAPLLLLLCTVATMVFGHDAAVEGVIRQIQALGGTQLAGAAKTLLASPPSEAHGILATIFGIVTLLFGASGVLVELRDALNLIWDVPSPELSGMNAVYGAVRARLFSFALILAVGFLLVVSLAVSAWVAALGAYSSEIVPTSEILLHFANFILSFIISSGLFAAIYKFVPNVSIEWRDVAFGGAVTAVLFSLGKLGLGVYLGKATFASAYGAAASIVALIVWVYYSAQIFFLGAEFTRVFAERHGTPPCSHPSGKRVLTPADERPTPSAIELS
ncbi:MAG TPA: YihY/virulence factor BrkB family protein [Bryobacteraceae bacterium]|nr:YihY/virulence factor BrkB family protein [Bryobacteraceae bacterium]